MRACVSLRSLFRSEAGNIAIITALIMPMLIGFLALGVETSYWYYRHVSIQDAADIAAYGGAVVHARGGSDEEIAAAARSDAITNGWRADSGRISVTQQGRVVEVELTEYQPRFFTRFLCGSPSVPISATGAARSAGNRDNVRVSLTTPPGNSRQIATVSVTPC
jgi:Flp pilus assembly protein TadG